MPNFEKMVAARDVEGLMKLLAKAQGAELRGVCVSLAAIGSPAVPRLIAKASQSDGKDAGIALAMTGEAAVQPVVAALLTGQARLLTVLAALAQTGTRGATEALEKVAHNHSDESVRNNAAELVSMANRQPVRQSMGAIPWAEVELAKPKKARARFKAAQSSSIHSWKSCPACGGPLMKEIERAVQCCGCSRCYADAAFMPVVSRGSVGWGRLEGAEPWAEIVIIEGELENVVKPWTCLPPEMGLLSLSGVALDFELLEDDW